jgi:hypothetical protein
MRSVCIKGGRFGEGGLGRIRVEPDRTGAWLTKLAPTE